jgi:thiamine biosynthesis lipoprotein
MRDGERISHTIDPRTGRPVTHLLASVTVIADDCEWADAWATALMVLGPDEGYNVAERQGLVALFLSRHEDGTISRKQTPGFAAHLSGTPASAPQDGPNNRGHRSEGVSPS